VSESWPNVDTLLRDYPWVVVRFRCHYCKRAGDSRLAICAQRYGAGVRMADLLSVFVSRCPYDPHSQIRKPQKYGHHCGAYMPDLGRPSPPDLSPAMSGLTLIEGGKDEQLPAQPRPAERRRRIDGDDG
jgi:hypothetical protein